MSQLIKTTCINSTYINNLNPYNNFSNENFLLIGIQKNSSAKRTVNVSILTFPCVNIDYNEIENASLSLYLKKAIYNNSHCSSLKIIGNCDNLDISNITYNNLQINDFCGETIIEMDSIREESLLQLDITDLIKELLQNQTDYNIIIMPNNNEESCFEFSLLNSNPYITISYKKDILPSVPDIHNNITNMDEEIAQSDNMVNLNVTSNSNDALLNNLHDFINEHYSNLENIIEKNINELMSFIKSETSNYNKSLIPITAGISNLDEKINELSNKITLINKQITAIINSLMSLDDINSHIFDINKKLSVNTNSINSNKLQNIFKQLEKLNNIVNNILDTLSHITIEPF